MSDLIRALYDPESKQVACVLLQAAYGGDRRACQIVREWNVSPTAPYVWLEATAEQWAALARGELTVGRRPIETSEAKS